MKILCVIDSLGSGGAQRQMVNLACGLKAKGHEVEVFIYFPELAFFRPEVDAAGIPIHEVTKKSKGFSWGVLKQLTHLLRRGQFDGVISFLDGPNIYCELARLIALYRGKLLVSERRSFLMEQPHSFQRATRILHLFASKVVANSSMHGKWLQRYWWLKKKTHVIYNGYWLADSQSTLYSGDRSRQLSLLVLGRIDAGKNGITLLRALVLYQRKHGTVPTLLWAGRQEKDTTSLQIRGEMEQLLAENPAVAAKWQWLGERKDVQNLLEQCDALIHVSLFEGLPNAVCEALIAGRPVIASNVCDHPRLVEDGVRGVLCDPLSPESICAAIERLWAMSPTEWEQMGHKARAYAEEHLTIERMVTEYEALLLGPSVELNPV